MRNKAPSLLSFAVVCIAVGVPVAGTALLLGLVGLPWWCLVPLAWIFWLWLVLGLWMRVNRRCLSCRPRPRPQALAQTELRLVLPIAACIALCGCQTSQPPPEASVRKAQPIAKIDVRSIPTRCVVELNDEYLGMTPLEVVVEATESGNWASQGFGSVFVMRCSTPDGNGWEQKVWYPGNPIPKRVLFRIPGATQGLAFN